MSDDNGAAEIKTPLFSASVKGKDVQIRDIIGITVLLVTSITAYAVWEHQVASAKDTTQLKTEFTSALKEMVNVNRDIAQGQRVMNCLLATDQKDREARLSTCERIAR